MRSKNEISRYQIMIDIHSHLLYAVDDGPQSFQASVEMLEAAARDGVTSIIATPHFAESIAEEIPKKLEQLRPEAEKLNIELRSGCEYDFFSMGDQDKLITLGGEGKFVLVDFCSSFISPMTRNFLFAWQVKGYQVIIAHPERLFSRNELPTLNDLADGNIYFQLNAGSFRGDYGRSVRRFARVLAKDGLCHFIASDAHSIRNYDGQLPDCRKYIAKHLGAELENIIFEENPRRILHGENPISIW